MSDNCFLWWKRPAGREDSRAQVPKLIAPVFALVVGIAGATAASAAVIEFYNPDLNNYFITADPVEQAFVDTGAVGRWQRTGNAFAAGGPSQVCRFGGNFAINPATGTFYGPNSHFYTADPAECAAVKSQYTPNAKSWKFESNDFQITPATDGVCPPGLTPVYRAYNNGFAKGIDSNHRITSNYDAYQQTVAAGSTGEGVVMCAPSPLKTAAGAATGDAVTATIGAAGGTLVSGDGRVTVNIPPGALAVDTQIGIQPLANLSPGHRGAAYQFTPDGQAFLKSIAITFAYADQDLAGTAAPFLGAAYQTADGYWQWAGTPTLDANAKTVTIASTHFSPWSMVSGLQLLPGRAAVVPNGTVALQVVLCFDTASPDPRGYDCDQEDLAIPSAIGEWSVNSRLGGGGVFGSVAATGHQDATYTAPAAVPTPNLVAVSARVSTGANSSALVVSNIAIVEDKWTGTASATEGDVVASAEVTWTLSTLENNVATYAPSGTAHVVMPPCGVSPSSATITPANTIGQLVVDYNASPPSYHGNAGASWMASLSCPTGTFSSQVFSAFFAGSKGLGGTEAVGQVSADGLTIDGSDTITSGPIPVQTTWHFTGAN